MTPVDVAERSAIASFLPSGLTYRVSSVLRRNVREFGPKHLFDGLEDTCWNSDQGSPQSIELVFPHAITVTSVLLRFQGGFVGQGGEFYGARGNAETLVWERLGSFEPEDVSSVQRFPVEGGAELVGLRLVFARSSDLYGRVTAYELDVLGTDF